MFLSFSGLARRAAFVGVCLLVVATATGCQQAQTTPTVRPTAASASAESGSQMFGGQLPEGLPLDPAAGIGSVEIIQGPPPSRRTRGFPAGQAPDSQDSQGARPGWADAAAQASRPGRSLPGRPGTARPGRTGRSGARELRRGQRVRGEPHARYEVLQGRLHSAVNHTGSTGCESARRPNARHAATGQRSSECVPPGSGRDTAERRRADRQTVSDDPGARNRRGCSGRQHGDGVGVRH